MDLRGYIDMGKIKILGVYKWATMGGVERVFLNRAHAIKQANLDIQYDIFFFHDSGGKKEFDHYIKSNDLCDVMRLVDKIESYKYDAVLSIDTPEILEFVEPEKLFIECHTSYEKQREYLASLPDDIRGILVPSEIFKEALIPEISKQLIEKLVVVPNPVYVNSKLNIHQTQYFNLKPVLYLGRLDKLKNVEELIELISFHNHIEDDLFLILAGAIIEHELNLNKLLSKYGMINRTVYLPPLNFNKTSELLSIIKRNNGIFMSASLKESFGLSVAEAMCFGIPVLILNNPAHSNLVKGNDQFLFNRGQIDKSNDKLNSIINNYQESSNTMKTYALSFDADFINKWKDIFNLQ